MVKEMAPFFLLKFTNIKIDYLEASHGMLIARVLGSLEHLEVEMVLLPLIILLMGATATWYVRNRPTRIGWIISASAVLLVWLISLILNATIPDVTEVSVWRPQSMFLSQIELKLDSLSWPFVYVSTTLLLAVVLTYPARFKLQTRKLAIMLTYAVFPMIAMLSGNMLTFAVTWMLMDVASVIVMIDLFERKILISTLVPRLTIGGTSLILILLAALVNISEGGTSSLSGLFISSGTILFLSLAAMLRLGFFQFQSATVSYLSERHAIEILQQLLPSGAALALLARIFDNGIPNDVVPWLKLAGGITLLIGGVQWVFGREESRIQQAYKLAVSGLGIFIASSTTSDASVIVASGVLLILIGGVFHSIEIFSPAHRMLPILCAIIIAGCPWTPGGVALTNMIPPVTNFNSILWTGLGLLGMVLLCLGTLRYFFLPSVQWNTAESSVRFMYGLGLSFPVIVMVGLGLWMFGEINVVAVISFLVIAGLATLFVLMIRKIPDRDIDRWGRLLAWIDLNPIMHLFTLLGRGIIRVARGASDVMEGEGAMLWLVVILLLTYLGVQGIT